MILDPTNLATQPNPHPLATRPIYSESQLSTYLSALPCTPRLTLESIRALKATSPLTALRRLHLLTMALVPFGSLGIHYSPSHTLSLDPDVLFHKLVERRLGGYCMENNAFWTTVLRSLGYDAWVVGARVALAEAGVKGLRGDGFGGWNHEVVFVRLQDEEGEEVWLSDVGFGGRGSLEPIRLREGEVGRGMCGVRQRLARRGIADSRFVGGRELWVVDVPDEREAGHEDAEMGKLSEEAARSVARVRPEKGWRAAYCFEDVEWLPQDFETTNYRTCRDAGSMFVQNLILTKPILDEKGEKCVAQLTLVKDEFTRRLDGEDGKHGEKEVLAKCKTEAERVENLHKWFGIQLKEEEKRAIRGWLTEIRG
jgi:arylamine N-acetyltransferase